MLKFKDVNETESSLKTIGTVAEFIGEGGTYRPSSTKNFKGTVKENGELTNITLALFNAKGQREYVNCSAPVSKDLRSAKTAEELKEKLNNIGSFQILELPQFDRETGEPIMVKDSEGNDTDEQLTIYSISFNGSEDTSALAITVTKSMLKAEAVKRTIDWESLVAL